LTRSFTSGGTRRRPARQAISGATRASASGWGPGLPSFTAAPTGASFDVLKFRTLRAADESPDVVDLRSDDHGVQARRQREWSSA
jgi:hypothetical protein